MDNIKDIVNQVIGNIATHRPEPEEKIDRVLKNVLDPRELKHIQLVGEKEGCLSINVDSPAWLYQMQTHKRKILEKLQTEIPRVKDIRFKIGKVK